MTLLVLVALTLFAFSVLLVARAVLEPRARAADRLARVDAYGFGTTTVDAVQERERRSPIEALGALAARRLQDERVAVVRRRLLAAGMFGTSAEALIGYRVLSTAGISLLTYYTAASMGQAPAVCVLALVGGAVYGTVLPKAFVTRRARTRLEWIDRGMPELVDLLVVGVESGMGLAGAIRAAATRTRGPLGDELKLMLREQSLGASTTESLQHLLERCDAPATRSFVRTITQGERLGVSIGQMMRSLAEEMRKRRKAKAEELAQKAPVKILFPLVFLIFPAMFIVLLAPAAIGLAGSMGG